ncbi:hypothetical protein Tco_1302469 [Tanacetum coccineum]
MNIYKMPLEQFQVNTKFLNTLPDEWSKFVTDVKLVKDLHTTNVDQLHAHLQQHERHANEVRGGNKLLWLLEQQEKYTPGASAKIALMANLSRNGSDALTEVHNQDNLNYDFFNQSEQIMTSSEQSNDVSQTETDITSDSNIIPYSQYLSENTAGRKHVQNSNSYCSTCCLIIGTICSKLFHMMTKSKICYDHSSKQAIGFEKPFYLKKAWESKPKLYDGNTILKMDTIVIPDSDETLELSEEESLQICF